MGYAASLGNDPGTYFTLEAISPGDGAIHTKTTGDYAESSYYSVYQGNITSWQASGDTEYWVFEPAEEVTVSLNSDGGSPAAYFATFCAPFSYTVSGATAYSLEKNGEWLVPTEVEGEVIAGTPVLLKGSSATATLTIGSGYAATPLTTTDLTGTYLATTIDGANDYVLGKGTSGVGFYHWGSNNLAANRAYLTAANAAVKGYGIKWDEADGINVARVNNEEKNNEQLIFNLSGQRLNKLQKGVNIVNGKKAVVK